MSRRSSDEVSAAVPCQASGGARIGPFGHLRRWIGLAALMAAPVLAQDQSVNILHESVKPFATPASASASPVVTPPVPSIPPTRPVVAGGLLVRILPRPAGTGEVGPGCPAAGTSLLYYPGETATVRAIGGPTGPERVETVRVQIRSTLTHPHPRDVELRETAPGTHVYEGPVKLTPDLVGQDSTLDRSYMVIRAGPGNDATAFERALAGGGVNVPHICLGSVDTTHLATGPQPDAKELLAAGGAERVIVSAGASTDTFWGARPADWIYVSAPYDQEDGLRTLGNIRPDALAPGLWANNTDLVILTGGYAVDVADFNGIGQGSILRGMHGVLWWKRFNGTLLGYSGAAPSHGAGAIITRFIAQLATAKRNLTDERAESQLFVQTWMETHRRLLISTAAAVDSEGNYYFIPRDRQLTLRGIPYTIASVPPWVKLRRQVWETRLTGISEENRLNQAVAMLLAHVRSGRGGRLPAPADFVTDQNIHWVAAQVGWRVQDTRVRTIVQDALHRRLDYERHLHQFTGGG